MSKGNPVLNVKLYRLCLMCTYKHSDLLLPCPQQKIFLLCTWPSFQNWRQTWRLLSRPGTTTLSEVKGKLLNSTGTQEGCSDQLTSRRILRLPFPFIMNAILQCTIEIILNYLTIIFRWKVTEISFKYFIWAQHCHFHLLYLYSAKSPLTSAQGTFHRYNGGFQFSASWPQVHFNFRDKIMQFHLSICFSNNCLHFKSHQPSI